MSGYARSRVAGELDLQVVVGVAHYSAAAPATDGAPRMIDNSAGTKQVIVNLLCHGRARASFSLTLRAGAMRLERIGRLGGAAAAGGGRDALSYGVSFATTRSDQLGGGEACRSRLSPSR